MAINGPAESFDAARLAEELTDKWDREDHQDAHKVEARLCEAARLAYAAGQRAMGPEVEEDDRTIARLSARVAELEAQLDVYARRPTLPRRWDCGCWISDALTLSKCTVHAHAEHRAALGVACGWRLGDPRPL